MIRRRRVLLAVGAFLLLVVVVVAMSIFGRGDSSEESTSVTQKVTTSVPPTTTTTEPDDSEESGASVPGPPFTVSESLASTIDVYDTPDSATPSRTLDRADELSGKLVFLVASDSADGLDRLEVFLPVRPNGSMGWVDAADVITTEHEFRAEVRLGDHRLMVWEGDEIVLDTAIAVGTESTPTPGGVFFIKELLQPPSPDGPYGTYAYGLSGFSNVLESFSGGEGVIGVHGTNDPAVIGSDVSSGCIRITNADIEMLVEDVGLPLGTPVSIVE